jgi:hypothetical protein
LSQPFEDAPISWNSHNKRNVWEGMEEVEAHSTIDISNNIFENMESIN